jgi:hypothetical protein
VRESRSLGSVRGDRGNPVPYREQIEKTQTHAAASAQWPSIWQDCYPCPECAESAELPSTQGTNRSASCGWCARGRLWRVTLRQDTGQS